jgi:chemotaxis protein MotA
VDAATLIGIIGGTLLVVWAALMDGNAALFWNVPSVLIVVGGTTATVFIRYPLADVLSTLRIVRHAFVTQVKSANEVIAEFLNLSHVARKDGLLSLERLEFNDAFLRKGIAFCVDGAESRQIESILLRDIQSMRARHQTGQAILRAVSVSSPSFGMIGTLIGLVQMFTGMDDPKKIGPGMAVAILTTLYGAVIAYLFAIPLADKLAFRSAQETDHKLLILEGVLALKRGENPRMIEETLNVFVAPRERLPSRFSKRTEAEPESEE